jgi:para-aminobenzoate synthetase component 2
VSPRRPRILVIDNYDSFVYNLVQYLAQLGADPVVRRNDEPGAADIVGFDGVLTSPGPSTPESAGVSVPIVAECAERRLPLLGVCLGHQAIGVAFGATVTRAPELLHGKTSEVYHKSAGVLDGLPDPFTATRYHSLESVLTESGHVLLANWLAACGHPDARDLAPAFAAEVDALRLTAFAPV